MRQGRRRQTVVATAEPHVIGPRGRGHGYAFGDINGDGREDILCESGWYERPEAAISSPNRGSFHPETLSGTHPSVARSS